MTTFDRRQRIIDLITRKPGIGVAQIADRLGVPEATVRGDLRALAEGRQLPRGIDRFAGLEADGDPLFAAQARANAAAKQLMARWAADLVQDGDVILFDASTTVYYMARYVRDRRNLTVVTTGIEAARALGQDPSNTVILLGGLVGRQGQAVTGLLNEDVVCGLNVKTAFVSCAGFALETGLAEPDEEEAKAKRQMIACAETVVALIDASKFGRRQSYRFAMPADIHRIFTDAGTGPDWLARLEQAGVPVTVCDESKAVARNPTSLVSSGPRYKIGFANLGDTVPFAIEVRQGLEQVAAEVAHVDLVMADNQLDATVALRVAKALIATGVDLAIEFQIDQQANDVIMGLYRDAGIPVIAVDIPMHGATFFGVDNYRAGLMAGTALGHWVKDHWNGECDAVVLMEEPRAGNVSASRLGGQLAGLEGVIGPVPAGRIIHLDCSNLADVAAVRVGNLLPEIQGHRLVFLSINDDAAIGALEAIRRAGRENDAVIAGQGATRRGRAEIRRPGTRLIGATAFRPETYGGQLLALAEKILRGEAVPPAVFVDHVFITKDNVDELYPDD